MDESGREWSVCVMGVEMRRDVLALSVSFLLSMGVYVLMSDERVESVEVGIGVEERYDDGDSENIEWMSSEEGRRMIWVE